MAKKKKTADRHLNKAITLRLDPDTLKRLDELICHAGGISVAPVSLSSILRALIDTAHKRIFDRRP